MRDLVTFLKSKRTRSYLECSEIHVLKKPGNLPEINSIENVWNIIKNEIGYQLPSLEASM